MTINSKLLIKLNAVFSHKNITSAKIMDETLHGSHRSKTLLILVKNHLVAVNMVETQNGAVNVQMLKLLSGTTEVLQSKKYCSYYCMCLHLNLTTAGCYLKIKASDNMKYIQ